MVLDSSVLLAIFKQEPGYEKLEQKIDKADSILVGAPTLVETAIVLARLSGKDQRVLLEAYLRRIGGIVVEFTESHYSLAGEAFVRFGRGFNSKANLNYGDCMSYAVAVYAGEPLLFVGNDFSHTDVTPA
ncbi:MAG: type II toxin-antitoxin system VapC family toxin [Acidobacteria bacterium]|nr:type II toxin-antitoxin system VapC family toxin [Acidobacteriota bacterium]